MSDAGMDGQELWIRNELMPRVVSANGNNLFTDKQIVKCNVQGMEGNKDNWASTMFAVNMTLRDVHNGGDKLFQLLVKIMVHDENVRLKMHSDLQFSNEIHLYSVALPYFKSHSTSANVQEIILKIIPECYYTSLQKCIPGNPRFDDGIVIMEDLRDRDYKLGNRTFLDLAHCMIAMETIGTFHALSYLSKERDPNSFENIIVKPICETNYAKDHVEMVRLIFSISQRRVLDALDKMLGEEEVSADRAAGVARLRDIAARDPYDSFLELAKPKEPLAALCHGDFLRNNVLFRYEGGAPADMKLIDFQTVRYASPAIDVSLFLCMNTSRALRAEHLDALLRAYHRSLRATLCALLGVDEARLPPRYDFHAFLQDFRAHALYGYFITIEFMPWMMTQEEELAEYFHLFMNEMFTPAFREKARVLGGEATTKVLVELALDLIDFGCI